MTGRSNPDNSPQLNPLTGQGIFSNYLARATPSSLHQSRSETKKSYFDFVSPCKYNSDKDKKDDVCIFRPMCGNYSEPFRDRQLGLFANDQNPVSLKRVSGNTYSNSSLIGYGYKDAYDNKSDTSQVNNKSYLKALSSKDNYLKFGKRQADSTNCLKFMQDHKKINGKIHSVSTLYNNITTTKNQRSYYLSRNQVKPSGFSRLKRKQKFSNSTDDLYDMLNNNDSRSVLRNELNSSENFDHEMSIRKSTNKSANLDDIIGNSNYVKKIDSFWKK